MVNLTGYIRSKLDKFRDRVAENTIASAMGPVGQITNKIQQIPQIKTQINKIPNIQLRPNAPTLGQAAQNAIRSPLDFPMQLTTQPKTGNKFMDLTNEYVTNTGGQALKNVMNVGSFGLINTQAARPTNIVQRAGGIAGSAGGLAAGFAGPLGVGLGKIGLGGEAAVKGLLPRATPGLIARVAPAIGGEAAQTGAFVGAKKALGQDINPLTDIGLNFGLGLGFRGVTGLPGAVKDFKEARSFAKNQYKYIEPGDKADIVKKVETLLMRGGEADYDIRFRAKDEKFLRQMAGDYVNKSFAQKASIQDIAQELMNRVRGEDNMELMDLPTMGLVGKGQAKAMQKVGDIVGDSNFKPGSGMAQPKETKYAFNINKQRLQINPEQKAQLDEVVEQVKPQLEEVKGKKLSFDEVRAESQKAELLTKVVGRESTQQFEGSLLATRERLTTLNNEIERLKTTGDTVNAERLTKELIDQVRVVSSQAADIGRKLGSFRIQAQERPFREQLIEEIIKKKSLTDAEIDKLTKGAAKVDFNNPQEVQKFYREFIQPSIGSMLEEYRYFNLLSSPLTHVVNTFSNALQAAAVKPTTKLVSGFIDPVAAALGSKQRENYIGEVPMYYRGMFAAIPEAFKKVADIYSGKQMVTNLDFKTLDRTPSKFNMVTKTLEASDQFFRTLIEGAEREAFGYKFAKQGTKVAADDIAQLAKQSAEYSTYRQGLMPEGQGAVLNWIDKGTNAILGLRKVPGVSWFIPFVQTPMNIFKQGVEYSPVGFSTAIGAANKREQVAKAMLGSTVFASAGLLALQDKLTWAAPKDPEQKKNFYAAGMQPYSVKIGDKWVSYSKLGPLSYPLAMAAGIKYSFKDDPNAAANDTFEKLSNSLAGVMGFFGDQSYVQGIGNIVNAFGGEEGYDMNKIVASVPAQYIPASSFQRWVNNIIDPIYRKPGSVVGNLKSNVIGMTGDLGFYDNPFGEPSKRQYPLSNAINPLRTTKENPEFKELYDLRQEKLRSNAIIRREKKDLEAEIEKAGLNPASAAEKQPSRGKLIDKARIEAQEEIARDRTKLTGETQKAGGKIFYLTDEGEVKSFSDKDIQEVTKLPSSNKYEEEIKESKAYSVALDIANLPSNALSNEEKEAYFKKLGVTKENVEYYNLANNSNNEKTLYVLNQVSKTTNRDEMLLRLVELRKNINGKLVLGDGVIDNLVDEGIITKDEGKSLKRIDYDRKGKLKIPGPKKPKKIAIKVGKARVGKISAPKRRKISLKPLKVENPKPRRVKYQQLKAYDLTKKKKNPLV